MFLGPKLSTVFASRWKALAWSGSVLLTAYCSVPDNDGATKSAAPSPAVAMVTSMLGAGPAQPDRHASPWDITRPAPTPGH